MSGTVREIVDATLKYIGEVSGPGVQTYSEDIVFDSVVRGFDLMFKRRFWEQYIKWFSSPLDGTLGIISSNLLSKVRDFEDFIAVYRNGQTFPLPIKPSRLNPYAIGTGNRVLMWTSLHVTDTNYAGRKLQFYPVASTDTVNIGAREYPLSAEAEAWDWEDVMYLDMHLLTYAGAYAVLASDDLNSQAASMAQAAMESKYKDIVSGLSSHPLASTYRSGIPDQWYPLP